MPGRQLQINELLVRGNGVILVRDVPSLRRTLFRHVEAGVLVPVLRGVLVEPGLLDDPMVLAQAVCRAYPNAVLAGTVAAHLSYWPGAARLPIEVRHLRMHRPPTWLRTSRSRVPAGLVHTVGGLSITAPELTALDLAEQTHGESVFALLRSAPDAAERLDTAVRLTPHRRGNAARVVTLRRVSNNPWSGGEQAFQAFLRAQELLEFEGNVRVRIGGRVVIPDLALRRLKIAVEFDSVEFHTDRDSFESDRHKHNLLTSAGWRVLHITWRMLFHTPDDVLRWIRAVMALGEREAWE